MISTWDTYMVGGFKAIHQSQQPLIAAAKNKTSGETLTSSLDRDTEVHYHQLLRNIYNTSHSKAFIPSLLKQRIAGFYATPIALPSKCLKTKSQSTIEIFSRPDHMDIVYAASPLSLVLGFHVRSSSGGAAYLRRLVLEIIRLSFGRIVNTIQKRSSTTWHACCAPQSR